MCKYFIGGECYENYTTTNDGSACDVVLGGYFMNGRCYYHVQHCSAGQYLIECTCYPYRSAVFSNDTCVNIGGFYTDDYCYYTQFSCLGYAVNNQCYSRVL